MSGCSGASFKLRHFARAMSRHSEARLRAAIRIVKLLLIRRKSKSSTHTHWHTHTLAHTATISCDAKAKAPLAEDDITRRQDPTLSPALTLTITLQLLLTYSLSPSLSYSLSLSCCLSVCLSVYCRFRSSQHSSLSLLCPVSPSLRFRLKPPRTSL